MSEALESYYLTDAKPKELPFLIEAGQSKLLHSMLEREGEQASDLRVLWYNIGTQEPNHQDHYHALTTNLDLLTRMENAPDLFVFAEAQQFYLGGMFSNYPFKKFIPYSKLNPNCGIYVVSKTPFNYEHLGSLAWQLPHTQVSGISSHKNHSRPMLKFKVDVNGKVVTLLPLHLANPWKPMGIFQRIRHLLWGRTNELMVQIQDFKTKLKNLFGPELNREPFVVFGDMNTPSLNAPFQVPTYKELATGMGTSFEPFPTHTFPVKGTGHREPRIKIDHSLENLHFHHLGSTQYSLPLKGSDHRPLLISLRSIGPGGLI